MSYEKKCTICGVEMYRPWTSGICMHCDFHLGQGYTEEQIREMVKNNEIKKVSELIPLDFTPEQLREARYRLMDKYIEKFGNIVPQNKMLTLWMPKVSDAHYELIFQEEDKE